MGTHRSRVQGRIARVVVAASFAGSLTVASVPGMVGITPAGATAVNRPAQTSLNTVCHVAGRALPYDADVSATEDYPLNQPTRLVSDDAGNVFVIDSGNGVIRRYANDANRTMTIVAGNAAGVVGADGLSAIQNAFRGLADIAVTADGTTLYILEDFVIRKVTLATGDIETVAGIRSNTRVPVNGQPLPTATRPALGAPLGVAVGLALSADRLYVLSIRFDGEPITGSRVHAIDLTSGDMFPVMGNNNPALAVEKSAQMTFGNPGITPATDLYFNSAYEIELNPNDGRLYVMSTYGSILGYDPVTTNVIRDAGSGTLFGENVVDGAAGAADIPANVGFGFRGNDVVIAQTEAAHLRYFDRTARTIDRFAGNGAASYQDGENTVSTPVPPGGSITFALPFDITQDAAGNLYVSDTLNNVIRKVDTTNNVSTISPFPNVFAYPAPAGAMSAMWQDISGMAVDDSGGYYVADNATHLIWYVDVNGITHRFAGSGSHRFRGDVFNEGEDALAHAFGSGRNGTGYIGDLRFARIDGESFLYLMEGWDPGGSTRLVRIAIDRPGHPVTTVAGNGGFGSVIVNDGAIPTTVGATFHTYAVAGNGDVYLSNRLNGQIFKIEHNIDAINLWAGAAVNGANDLSVTANGGNRLTEFVGLVTAIDVAADGTVYFASQNESVGGTRIFSVGSSGNVTLIGGSPGNSDIDTPNGAPAVGAHLGTSAIRVDNAGQVFLSDEFMIRRIDTTTGTLQRVMGPFDGVFDDPKHTLGAFNAFDPIQSARPALAARSTTISDFDIAPDGTVYFAEDHRFSGDIGFPGVLPLRGSNRIRRLVPGTNCNPSIPTPVPSQTDAGTILVTAGAFDTVPAGAIRGLAATPDLSYIVYASTANEADPAAHRRSQVFLYERQTGRTQRVNLTEQGLPDPGGANEGIFVSPSPSVQNQLKSPVDVVVRPSDGHVLVAFNTDGALIAADETEHVTVAGPTHDIYVKDMTSGTLSLVSTDSAGAQLADEFWAPSFDPDGMSVVFHQRGSNLAFRKLLDGSDELEPVGSSPDQVEDTEAVADGGVVVSRLAGEISLTRGVASTTITTNGEHAVANHDGSVVAFRDFTTRTVFVWRAVDAANAIPPHNLDLDPNKPAGSVASALGLNADGTKLAVAVTDGAFRRPWLVDITNPANATWTALDTGASRLASDSSVRGAALDRGGRRIALISTMRFDALPVEAGAANQQLYLRDTHLVDTTPTASTPQAAVRTATAIDPTHVKVFPDGTLVYWDSGELWRLEPDGTTAQITTGASGPFPISAVADGARGSWAVAVADSSAGNFVSHNLFDSATTIVGPMPTDLVTAVAYDGVQGELYFSTYRAIYQVRASGSHQRVAGDPALPTTCTGSDGVNATAIALCAVTALDVGPNGKLYFVDGDRPFSCGGYCTTIREFTPGSPSSIRTIAGQLGPLSQGASEDGVDARTTRLQIVSSIAAAADGSVYIADNFYSFDQFGATRRIRRIGPDGIIKTIAGGDNPDGLNIPGPTDRRIGTTIQSIDVTDDGDVVFVMNESRLIGSIVSLDISLTSSAGAASVQPGVTIVPTKFIATRAIEPVDEASTAPTLEAAGIGDIDFNEPLANTLQASPLRAIPLRAIPLRAILLSSTPLRAITLSQIPVDYPGGWDALLAGTPLDGQPLQTVSLLEALELGEGAPLLADLPFGALDLASTPLRAIALASIALGSTPLRAIPLPDDGNPVGSADEQLSRWCSIIEDNGLNCASDFGIDPQIPESGDSVSLLALNLAGIPLRAIPLRAIPLRAIDLEASPLRAIPLRAIDLQASPLRAIPLRAIVLQSSPLRAIPLRAIPLRAIDLSPSPLRAIPLRAIGNADELIDCTRVDCSPTSNDTLETAADLEPSAIRELDDAGQPVTLGRLIDSTLEATTDAFVLGDLFEYGDATVGNLIDALAPDAPYTFGDLLMALVPVQDFPWEELDLNRTADMRQASVMSGEPTTSGVLRYRSDVTLHSPVGQGQSIEATVQLLLPPGYNYVPGTATLVRAQTTIALADPAGLDPVRAPTLAVADLRNGDSIEFDVVPGVELRSSIVGVTIAGGIIPVSDTASVGQTIEGEWEEPNDSIATARTIAPDNIYLSHLANPSDVDLFKLTVADGQTMSAILSNLPADFDLTLYSPAPTALANRTGERILVPVQDEIAGLSSDGTAAPAEPGDDIALEDELVYAVGQRRDAGDERIDTGRLRAGVYYLKVTGFNGAASTKPYALRVTLNETPSNVAPCATWSFTADTVSRGSLPTSAELSDANTIFVVNRERLFGKFPAQANDVMNSLASFITATDANAALGVRAAVVEIDGDEAVHTAALNWEQGTNRCDPLAARNVSSAMAARLDTILADHPQIQHVVMIGGDDLVPFGRVPDTTRLANERDFAQELDGNNELSAAARGGWVLTDDVYVDRAPIKVGAAELYVPNVALGRLVENPSDIISALQDFVTYQGHLDARSALSTGYDFLTDGANAVQAALVNNGFTTDANTASLIGETWSAAQLKDALLGLNGFTVPDIASINAHFDDYRALPADEHLNNSETNLFTTDDLPQLQTLARSLLFSVGCHGGLNVADTTQPGRGSDWAQSYATQGAIWIGNTGFGYGDTEVVAVSEKLMAIFAEQLNGRFTVGQALLLAKQGYVADLGDIVTAYDVKVSQQLTYYGLPMYRLQATAAVPGPIAPAPAVTIDPRVGLNTAPVTLATSVGTGPGQLAISIEDRGTYYTIDGDALTVQNRPIQPRTTYEVSRIDPATGTPLGVATGMLVTGLISFDQPGVNPAVFRPIVDSSDEAEPKTSENVFPAAPVSIGAYTDLATVNGSTQTVNRQQVVAIPGQFRADPIGTAGTQRLFTEISGTVFYAAPGNTDTAPPTIEHVDATITQGGANFVVRASDDGDPTAVKRVYVLATPSNPGTASITWLAVDLARTGSSTWTGTIAVEPGTTSVDFLVQVVDAAGNVGVSSNKGALYQTETDPAPQPEAPVVTFTPAVDAGGWLGSAATVTASDPLNLAMSYSVDGTDTQLYTGSFTVSGAGVHEVVVRNTAGLRTVIRIPIDLTGPSVACASAPTTWSGTDVTIACSAADDGAGLVNPSLATFGLTTSVPDDTETTSATTGSRDVCDLLGRCTTAGPVTGIRVDRKAPSVAITTPAANAVYVEGQVVSAVYACSDDGSGVAGCSGPVPSGVAINTATPGIYTFVVNSTDAVGNVTSNTIEYTVRDGGAPVIVCADVPAGWSPTNVALSCTASDTSGLADPSLASFTLSTNVAPNTETATATTGSQTVCDISGNCSTAGPFAGIKVDRKAPVITVTRPLNAGSYAPGDVVTAAYSCDEGGSGETSCVGTVASGAVIDTTPGSKTFTVTSSDAVGNTSSTTVIYTVTSTNNAPVVRADMGVVGLQEIGFQTGAVALTGSFTDPDGAGPYTASVRWSTGGPFTPLVLANGSQFVAAWIYATAGTRTVTVRVCDAAGACGTDDVTVRSSVSQRITPTRCIIDNGANRNPRWTARFGYINPATFAIAVPHLAGTENTFTSNPAMRGQPLIFLSGSQPNAFQTTFHTGSIGWRLNGTTATANSRSPRC